MPNELLPALKGAPISILFVLCSLDPAGPPLTVQAVAQLTGYGYNATRCGLTRLVRLGLAEYGGRGLGWRLTPAAGQLPLAALPQGTVDRVHAGCTGETLQPIDPKRAKRAPAPDQPAGPGDPERAKRAPVPDQPAGPGDPERAKRASAPGQPAQPIDPERAKRAFAPGQPAQPIGPKRAKRASATSPHTPLREEEGLINLNPDTRQKTSSSRVRATTARGRARPVPPPDAWQATASCREPVDLQRLAELIVARRACPRAIAVPAVRAALARGTPPEQVELDILAWDGWLAVEQNARGLHSPGLFIAAKLRNAEPPPPNAAVAWPDCARAEALRRALARDELRIGNEELRVTDDALRPDVPADDEPAGDVAPDAEPPDAGPPEDPLAGLWTRALAQLRVQLPRSTYETWLTGTALRSRAEGAFVVQAPTSRAREWLAMRLRRHITRTLSDLAGCPATVTFVVPEDG